MLSVLGEFAIIDALQHLWCIPAGVVMVQALFGRHIHVHNPTRVHCQPITVIRHRVSDRPRYWDCLVEAPSVHLRRFGRNTIDFYWYHTCKCPQNGEIPTGTHDR